jgi:hypothetical protein
MSVLPQSIWSGSLHFLGVEMRVHVLDDGQRIIEADGFAAFLRALEGGSTISQLEAESLARFAQGRGVPTPEEFRQ